MRTFWLIVLLALLGAGYFWIQSTARYDNAPARLAATHPAGSKDEAAVERALRPSSRTVKDLLEDEKRAKKRKVIQSLFNKKDPSTLHLFKPSADTIHAALADEGVWMKTESGDDIWYPSTVEPQWRPFTHGRWVFSSEGWLWEGQEEWAWLAFHYGHWKFTLPHGWGWIPDDVWSPANVAWRANDHLVAWAPLPPGDAVPERIRIRSWVGVSVDHLMENDLFPHIIPPDELAPFVERMKVIASARRYHGRRLYTGPSLGDVLAWRIRLPPPVDSLAWRMQNPVRYAKHLSRGHEEGWYPETKAEQEPAD